VRASHSTISAKCGRYPVSVWRARRRLRQILVARRFDAAVCHGIWPQAIFGPTVRRARTPLVFGRTIRLTGASG
jgi:hypothetical protein